MPAGHARDRALDHLFRGQSNDCYWHGLFGGIYTPHLRLATFEHLIAAEDLAETAAGSLSASDLRDLDMDGVDEVRLADAGQVVTVDLAEGAGIGSWDIRAVRHALTAVLRRRPEAYHELLREHETTLAPAARPAAGDRSGGAPASIHEAIWAKEPGLAERLAYDAFERRSGLVRVLPIDATPEAWAAAAATELSDAVEDPYELLEIGPGRLVARRDASLGGARVAVTKTLTLGGERRSPTLQFELALEQLGGPPIEARLGIEWTTIMLGGGGNPAAWWKLGAGRLAHDSSGSAGDVTVLAQGNDDVGIAVTTTLDAPADVWWAPVETISNSEGGFERVYQGSGALFSWPIRLTTSTPWRRTIRHAVATARDRASEDA
jgi:alpha-amylase